MKPMPLSALAALLLAAALPAVAADTAWPTFTDITDSAGLAFKHSVGDFDLSNIVEATGPGSCVFDFDHDGFQDLA